jgi:hypothetical protein
MRRVIVSQTPIVTVSQRFVQIILQRHFGQHAATSPRVNVQPLILVMDMVNAFQTISQMEIHAVSPRTSVRMQAYVPMEDVFLADINLPALYVVFTMLVIYATFRIIVTEQEVVSPKLPKRVKFVVRLNQIIAILMRYVMVFRSIALETSLQRVGAFADQLLFYLLHYHQHLHWNVTIL